MLVLHCVTENISYVSTRGQRIVHTRCHSIYDWELTDETSMVVRITKIVCVCKYVKPLNLETLNLQVES